MRTMTLCLMLVALVCQVSDANGQGHEGKVLSVEQAYAVILPASVLPNAKVLVVLAKGTVPSTEWFNGRLVPYVYVVPPKDGIWDFDFVATRRGDISIPVLTPIVGSGKVGNPPSWVKGVRVHSGTNSVTYRLGDMSPFATRSSITEFKAASLSLRVKYERHGDKHCLVAVADIDLGVIDTEIELGRHCISVNGNCLGLEFEKGGVTFKGKICIEDDKLCLYLKGCVPRPFGGEWCTPTVKACAEID